MIKVNKREFTRNASKYLNEDNEYCLTIKGETVVVVTVRVLSDKKVSDTEVSDSKVSDKNVATSEDLSEKIIKTKAQAKEVVNRLEEITNLRTF